MEFTQYAGLLSEMGYQLYATKTTAEFLKTHGGVTSLIQVHKPFVKREPNVLSMLKAGKLDLVINVPDSMDSQALSDGFEMRRAAIDSGTSLIVDIKTAILVITSLKRKYSREQAGKEFFSLQSWQEYCEPRDTVQDKVGRD